MLSSSATVLALIGAATAEILWDGRLNNETSSAFLADWSFSNTTSRYYIHGTGPVTDYVNLDADYKNPADSGSEQGIQITLDSTAVWNSDNMLRTELIPQTSAPINKGKVFYHFSIQHTATNPPSAYEEHQVAFFESHFTELKYGLISGEQGTLDTQLRWDVGGVSEWNVTFEAGVWHNVAYAIDFDAGTVGFYHSTGGDDLKLTVEPMSAATSSNGADWHLGVLRLPSSAGRTDTAAEDWHFSGVYIESGEITTGVSGPGGAAAGSGAASSTAVKATSSSAKPTSKSSTKAIVTTPKPTTTSAAPNSSSVKPATTSKTVSSARSTSRSTIPPTSVAKPTTSSAASNSSVKPVSTVKVASSSTSSVASYTTASSSSALVKPSSSSSVVVAPVSTPSTISTTKTSSTIIAPTSQASSSTVSSAVSPISTSTPDDDDCYVNYIYEYV
ncbi:hypothetical protein LTR53_009130 [Teratosphaeriaceae sp. CCFEE 6253]|nr:hypothetical protein LTR53_009130 [Teratosphaeriaceae sp. CCFEE 6253]